MVEADARDHRDDRPGDVRRVEPAAEACLENGDVDLGPGKVVEGHGRHHLKPGRHARAAADRRGVELLDGRDDRGERAEEIGLGDRPAVDRDPLFEPMDVGGEVATDPQPCLAEDRGDHRHRRALPLRASHVDHRKGVVRVADQGEQPSHPRQAERAVAPRADRRLTFVVHPRIEPTEHRCPGPGIELVAARAGGGRPRSRHLPQTPTAP